MLKPLVIALFLVGALLEFVEVKFGGGLRVSLRREVGSTLSGTIFALIALLIWLLG